MSKAAVLELLLLAKDKMSPALQRLLKLFKQAEKDGTSGAKAVDKLTTKLERAPKTDGLKKHNAETKKTVAETEKAAKAEEKLNNARRKKPADNSTGKEVADKTKLAAETEKAAKAEEKLNNARKRAPKKSPDNSNGSGNRNSPADRKAFNQRRQNRTPKDFEDDLLAGGTGAGLLYAAKKGLTSATSKQEAMTDLRSAFYRSSISLAELNSQMREAERIADDLGNKLPGNTADYIQMFETMKQRGISTDSILKGGGKSAAYLSVANKEDRLDVGKNVARFGQMFNLQSEQEYMSAANLMSRAKTTYGINSDELMEAVKDFSGRTGKGLGLNGGKGAEDTLRYLSFLRAKTGMEGLTVGNSASSFFNQYLQAKQKKKDPTVELKKLTGVDLKIFDDKGKFLGLENAVKEFSKLKGKLSDEKMVSFGNALAGEEGASVFQAMVNNGDQWSSFNKELSESISLEEKSAKNAENLTNKFEALTGSLENLGAAGFGPLIAPLGKASDGMNTFVGYLTEAAKANPTFAGTTASVITLAGAFLTLKGGSGLASRFLGGVNGDVIAVGENAVQSATKMGRLKSSLLSTSGIFKALMIVELAGATWEQITYLRETIDKWKQTNKNLDDTGKQSYKAQQFEDATLKENNQTPDYKKRAQDALSLLQQGNKEFEKALDPSKMGWYEWFSRGTGALVGKDTNPALYQGRPTQTEVMKNPESQARVKEIMKMPAKQASVDWAFRDPYDRVQSEIAAVRNLQKRVPMLENPNTMASFRRDALPSMGLGDIKKQFVEQLLQQAFPQSYAESSKQLSTEQAKLSESSSQLMQSFSNLLQPADSLVNPMANLTTNSSNATNAVGIFANAANSAASRISNMQITPPTFSPIRIPMYQPIVPNGTPESILGRARGGSVKKGATYRINEIGQEFFTPNQSGSIVSNDILRNSSGTAMVAPSINMPVSFNIDGSREPEQIASEVELKLAQIVSQIKEELTPRNMARKVSYEAQRDAERV